MTPSKFGEAVARESAKAKKSAAKKTTESSGKNRDKPANRRGRVENLKPWKPGQSGNPGGRPRKTPITDAFRSLLDAPYSGPEKRFHEWTNADVLAYRQLELAINEGDLAAAKEIADRVEGKPMQINQLQGPGGGPIPIDHLTAEEKRRRIAELTAKANGPIGADGE